MAVLGESETYSIVLDSIFGFSGFWGEVGDALDLPRYPFPKFNGYILTDLNLIPLRWLIYWVLPHLVA